MKCTERQSLIFLIFLSILVFRDVFSFLFSQFLKHPLGMCFILLLFHTNIYRISNCTIRYLSQSHLWTPLFHHGRFSAFQSLPCGMHNGTGLNLPRTVAKIPSPVLTLRGLPWFAETNHNKVLLEPRKSSSMQLCIMLPQLLATWYFIAHMHERDDAFSNGTRCANNDDYTLAKGLIPFQHAHTNSYPVTQQTQLQQQQSTWS